MSTDQEELEGVRAYDEAKSLDRRGNSIGTGHQRD
jgi:hypothetical protein